MPRSWYTTDRVRALSRRIGAFLGVIFILWFCSFVPLFAPIYHVFQGILYQTSSAIGQGASRLFANEDSLSSQLSLCSDRLSTEVLQSAEAEQYKREVEELESLIGYTSKAQKQGVPARIIARSSPETSEVIIDQGLSSGIEEKSAVIIGEGILYGTVESVSETSSIVRLTEDSQSILAGAILGKNKTIGLVSGKEGALLAMDFIPQDALLVPGDVVITSGLDGKIPEGLVIGIVSEIIATQSSPFIAASIALVHDPREWTSVFVLKPRGANL